MTTYKLYQVYCIEEGTTRRLHSFTEPTQCPEIHNDRTIDPLQTIIIDYKKITGNMINILSPKRETITNKNYFDIGSNFFFDSTIIKSITNIRVISRFENKSTTGSYTIRAYDNTNHNELCNGTFTNETSETNDLGEISNSPTSNSIIEIHVKTADSRDKVTIDNVIVEFISKK